MSKYRGGWALIVTPDWRAMIEFDARGRIFKADERIRWALGRRQEHVKEYLAGKNILLNYEEYSYGK